MTGDLTGKLTENLTGDLTGLPGPRIVSPPHPSKSSVEKSLLSYSTLPTLSVAFASLKRRWTRFVQTMVVLWINQEVSWLVIVIVFVNVWQRSRPQGGREVIPLRLDEK